MLKMWLWDDSDRQCTIFYSVSSEISLVLQYQKQHATNNEYHEYNQPQSRRPDDRP